MIDRRAFLFGAGTAAALGAGAAPALAAPAQGVVERFVRRSCPSQGLSDAEVADFAQGFLAHSQLAGARRRMVLFLMENRWAHAMVPSRVRDAQERQERHLVTRFALSTDLFDAGRDDGPPRYWGYADPYGAGCANPVARFEAR